MDEKTFRRARATGMRMTLVEGKDYDQVKRAIRKKYGVDWEEVAYRIDEEGYEPKRKMKKVS